MVEINVVTSNSNLQFGKFHFNKGEEYYSRKSKDGSQILIQDKFGEWYGIVNNNYLLANWVEKEFKKYFTIIDTIYAKNFKEAKKITG